MRCACGADGGGDGGQQIVAVERQCKYHGKADEPESGGADPERERSFARSSRRRLQRSHERADGEGKCDRAHQRVAEDEDGECSDDPGIGRPCPDKDRLLAEPAEEGRNAEHRESRESGGDEGDRHVVTQAAEQGDVARTGTVFEHAGDEE